MWGILILTAALIAGTDGDKSRERHRDRPDHQIMTTPGCGASRPALLEGAEGRISSPTRARLREYPDNSFCQWRITVPEGKTAHLQVERFSLEAAPSCQYDHLEVYDGADSSSTKVDRYCGNNIPNHITATSNVIFVQFTSDESITDTGFSIAYSAKDADEPACGRPEIHPKSGRIVGGREATPHSWPWQICLLRAGRHHCGGSILSKRYVITAAHCVVGRSTSEFSIVAGEHDLKINENTQQVIRMAAFTVHENYNPGTYDNDIAILHLAEDIRYTRQVKPICLPRGDVATGKLCITTGWGDTQGTEDWTVLRQVGVPIVDRAVCSSPNWYGNRITDSMICAGYPQGGRDSCRGDSGGPLMCREHGVFWLQGITSWGIGCAEPNKPGVYTRVARFVDWVHAKTSGTFQLEP